MAEITFNYCGFDSKKDFGIVLNDINRPITAEFKEQVTEIPGMLGDLYEGTSLGGKKFELEVSLLTENESDKNTGIVQQLTKPAYAPEPETAIVSPVLFGVLW